MKVAIVHDYLYDYGGAERVLEALKEVWPEAPVYTAWVDWGWLKENKPGWKNWEIRTSWFQRVPFKRKLTSPLRFLTPYVWENFDFSEFDVVVSSAAWFITKGIVTRPETLHVCYCHTPPRYLYGYPTARDWRKSWLTRTYAQVVNPGLRMYDFLAAQRVDKFVTNSENTRKRIQKFYRREAKVIYPPVGMEISAVSKASKGDYYLMVNRLVGMKRIDLAIAAAKKSGVNLKIVGSGREEKRLKRLAGRADNIEFLGHVSDERLYKLYGACKAVVYLAEEEDFGITPVEAMSFGKPVIAARSGGVQESVIDPITARRTKQKATGVLLSDLSVGAVARVLKNFDASKFSPAVSKARAKKFSKARFKKEMREFVESEYRKI